MSARICSFFAILLAAALIAQPPTPRGDFVDHGWAFDLPAAANQVREKLGDPTSTTQKQEPNRHDPSEMNLRTQFHYPGLMLEYLHAGNNDFITKIEILTARWPLQMGLNIGQPAERIVAALGPTTRSPGNQLCYQSDGAGYSEVCFTIDQGKIASVRWSSEPD